MLSRVCRLGATVVVLGLVATTAVAQGPGGRGGPGGGRGMGFGPRGTATELMGLLATPEIRKEVKLSDEGFAAVDKLLKENEAARGGGRGPGGPGGGAPGGGGPGGGAPGGGQPDPEREARMKQMQDAMAEGQKKTDEAVVAALSDEQKKALETLKGAKFEFPEALRNPFARMGMGGGFGGGFGGGGPGGRGPGGADQSDADREKARAEREQRMKESAQKAQETLDEVLPPEGMDRLIGLYVQLRGNTSITGELPSKKLGLSEADIKKIDEAVGKIRSEMMQNFGGGRGNRQGGRPNSESGT